MSTLHGSEGGEGEGQVEGGGGAEQAGAAQLQTRGLVLWNTGGSDKFRNGGTIVNNIGDIQHEWRGGVEWPEWPGHNNQVNTDISPPPSFSPKLMYDPHFADLYWSKHMGDSYRCKTI